MSKESSLARVRELLNQMDAAQSIDAEIQIIEALQVAVTPALLRGLVDAYDQLQARQLPDEGKLWSFLSDVLEDGVSLARFHSDGEGYFAHRDGKAAERAKQLVDMLAAPVIVASADVQAAYPECSGDPASCPENEGHGCCKPNQPEPVDAGEPEDFEVPDFQEVASETTPAEDEPPPEYSFDRIMADCLESLAEHDRDMTDPDPDQRPSITAQHEARFIRELIASHNELQRIKGAVGSLSLTSADALADAGISLDAGDTEGGSHD